MDPKIKSPGEPHSRRSGGPGDTRTGGSSDKVPGPFLTPVNTSPFLICLMGRVKENV